MESGLNARPRDYARFGLMMLHEGRWNGRQVVPRSWVEEATAFDADEDPADFYQYFWWVDPPHAGGSASYCAHGRFGQLVCVHPDEQVVVVRLGETDAGVDWQAFLGSVAARVAG